MDQIQMLQRDNFHFLNAVMVRFQKWHFQGLNLNIKTFPFQMQQMLNSVFFFLICNVKATYKPYATNQQPKSSKYLPM